MWKLLSVFDENLAYHLIVDKQYSIGRKDANILLCDDNSVSRKHALIKLSKSNNSKHKYQVTVTDSSKFGTFFMRKMYCEGRDGGTSYDFQPVKGTITLFEGDLLRIGLQKHILKFVYSETAFVTSGLDSETCSTLNNIASKLGIEISKDWTANVRFLVTKKVVLNKKVTYALATACNIVSVNYFSSLLECWEDNISNSALDPGDFLPPIAEENMDTSSGSFIANPARRNLFKHKLFVFMSSEQLEKYGDICKFAGGDIISVEDGKFHESLISAAGTVVIRYHDTSSMFPISSSQFDAIQTLIQSHNLRYVRDIEIPLALFYCCIDVYCNPSSEDGYILSQSQLGSSQSLSNGPGNGSKSKMDGKIKCTPYAPHMDSESPDLDSPIVPETIRPSGIVANAEAEQSIKAVNSSDISKYSAVENLVSGLLDDTDEIIKPKKAPKRKLDSSKTGLEPANKQMTPKIVAESKTSPIKCFNTKETEVLDYDIPDLLADEVIKPKRAPKRKPEIAKLVDNLSIAPDHVIENEPKKLSNDEPVNNSIVIDDALEIPETNEHMKSDSQSSALFDDSLWSTKSVKRSYEPSDDENSIKKIESQLLKRPCVEENRIASEEMIDEDKDNKGTEQDSDCVLLQRNTQSQSDCNKNNIKVEVPECMPFIKSEPTDPVLRQKSCEQGSGNAGNFISKNNGNISSSDSLAKVVFVDLCVSNSSDIVVPSASIDQHGNKSKDVKRFRKVWPLYMSQNISSNSASISRNSNPIDKVPEIIGGDDLFEFHTQVSNDTFGGCMTSHVIKNGRKQSRVEFSSSSEDSDMDEDMNPFSSQKRKK